MTSALEQARRASVVDSFAPLESTAPLIVYIDFKSPYAFIAFEPTRRLGASLGVAIDWRPLTLDIPSYLGSARLGRDGRVVAQNRSEAQWSTVKYAYRDARRYAALTGLTLRGTEKIWDTSLAHIAMWWARSQGAEVLVGFCQRLSVPFWRREVDLEDIGVVAGLLADAGADPSGFADYADGAGRVFHDATQQQAFDAGIFGVPTYVLPAARGLVPGDEGGPAVFFGREHLPMVSWLLRGRHGPPPDIAYTGETGEPTGEPGAGP